MAAELDELKGRLADACRILGVLGLANGCVGHLSARIPDSENLLVRARGPEESGVRYTTPAEIIEVTPDGVVAGDVKHGLLAPQEIFIHTEVYRARSDVMSVVHVHPPTVVLFTITGTPLLPVVGAYDPPALRLLRDGVPTYDRSVLINDAALGRDLAAALGTKNACLMRGHGITSAGSSIEEAALRAIWLDGLAEMNYRARLLGEPRPISDEDQDALAPIPAKPPRVGQLSAMWRYYRRFCGLDPA